MLALEKNEKNSTINFRNFRTPACRSTREQETPQPGKKVEEIEKKYELNNDSDEEYAFREVNERIDRAGEYRRAVAELKSFPVEKLSIYPHQGLVIKK